MQIPTLVAPSLHYNDRAVFEQNLPKAVEAQRRPPCSNITLHPSYKNTLNSNALRCIEASWGLILRVSV